MFIDPIGPKMIDLSSKIDPVGALSKVSLKQKIHKQGALGQLRAFVELKNENLKSRDFAISWFSKNQSLFCWDKECQGDNPIWKKYPRFYKECIKIDTENQIIREQIEDRIPSPLSNLIASFATKTEEELEALQTVRKDGMELRNLSKKLQNNKEIVLEAIKQNPTSIKYASFLLKKDRDVVKTAVQLNGWVLEHADKTLQDDFEIVLLAVTEHGESIEYASDQLKNDPRIVKVAILRTPQALNVAGERIRKSMFDKYEALAQVRDDGMNLRNLDKKFQNDPDIVRAAFRQSPYALQYASSSLRRDFYIVLEAVKLNGWVLEYAHPDLQDNFAIVKAAVQQHGDSLEHASDNLRKNRDIVEIAVKKSRSAWQYALGSIRKQLEIALEEERLSKTFDGWIVV